MEEDNTLTLICIGGSSLLFSRLFYNLYQQKKQEIQKIKCPLCPVANIKRVRTGLANLKHHQSEAVEIPKYQPNEELLRTVKASPQKRLAYAAVEGLVQPDGDPLASRYVPQCFGVVQKVQVEETWELWNPTSKTWFRRKMNCDKSNNTVPFHLGCPGSFASKVAVKIQSPLEAVGPYLEQVHHRVKYAKDGLVGFVLGELGGERPFSMEETEEILRVGSTLTGFGEIVLDQGGVLQLRPPTNGEQYFLFPTNYQGFLQTRQDTASMWKVFTALFGITGAALIFWVFYREYQKYQKKRGTN